MKVTPVKKAFGKYQPGQVFEFPSKAAKVYIKLGKLAEVTGTDETKVVEPEPVVLAEQVIEEPAVRISPLTGKPVRQYRNRSMESE